MLAPQEALSHYEQQLAQDDSQLAIMGIARNMAATQLEIENAERSITFNQTYVPTDPGPRPHPEDGGMDHEDWAVAKHEYQNADKERDEAIDYAQGKLQDAEDKLFGLRVDKKLVKAGDENVVSNYAQAERERIQKEIEQQQAYIESTERYNAYKDGTEVIGAGKLIDSVNGLMIGTLLIDAHNKTTDSGWYYLGDYAAHPDGVRRVFTRSFEDGKLPYNHQELLSLEKNDDGIVVQYSGVDNVDEEAVSRYGENVATGNHYSFTIHGNGRVGEQKHTTGPVSKHLPHLMNNGTVSAGYINDPEGSHSYGSTNLLTTEDMTIMQAKIEEVTTAMKEAASK